MTWEHQHHDLVSAKEECGKYPGVSVESLFLFHSMSMFPMWFVPRFVTTLPGYPIRYGLPLLRLLAPPCKGTQRTWLFFRPAESSPCILQPIAIAFCCAALAARPSSNDLQRPVMPTITRPSISIPHLVSHLLSPSLNHSSPRILRATFPPSPPENLYIPIIEGEGGGKKDKQIFPNKQLTELSPPGRGKAFFPAL